jgi:collagenase-like PrtC family protease
MVRVASVFGNTCFTNSAREPKRLSKMSLDCAKDFISEIQKLGIEFLWTLNTSCVGNIQLFFKSRVLRDEIQVLEKAGIDSLVIAHPAYLYILKEMKSTIPVEISTIMAIQEPMQLEVLKDIYPHITRICLPINKNRDARWIISICDLARKLDISVEIIANEFCFLNGCNCEGLFRHSCYDMNAHANPNDANNNYPREFCTRYRESDPVNWYRAKWILPQHMTLYSILGIDSFKITGRTHPTKFLKKVIPYYLARDFTGNILELWPQIQTIYSKEFDKDQQAVLDQHKVFTGLHIDKMIQQALSSCSNNCMGCNICERAYLIGSTLKKGY